MFQVDNNSRKQSSFNFLILVINKSSCIKLPIIDTQDTRGRGGATKTNRSLNQRHLIYSFTFKSVVIYLLINIDKFQK